MPDRPARELFSKTVVDAELEQLAGQQHDDGWDADFRSYSPQATLEWRGHVTVGRLRLLQENGLLH